MTAVIPEPETLGDLEQPRLAGSYWEEEARWAQLPAREWIVPQLLPIGANLLIAGPKIGKSYFAQQIEHEIAHGRVFTGLATSQGRCLMVDLEGDVTMVQERSMALAPLGDLRGEEGFSPMDRKDWRLHYVHQMPGIGFWERVSALDAYLTAAAQQGRPVRYVRIDTMRLFVGANERNKNAYDFDAANMRTLNQLAVHHNTGFLILHHLKKDGGEKDFVERASGSMGSAGSATSIMYLERARGAETGVLHIASRVAESQEHPMRFVGGRWEFAGDLTAAEARHSGVGRRILEYLRKAAAATAQELMGVCGCPRGTLDSALNRLSNYEGLIEYVDRVWRLVERQQVLLEHAAAADVSRETSSAAASLDTGDVQAGRDGIGPIPAEHGGGDGPAAPDDFDQVPEKPTTRALDVLKTALERSRMHPLPRVSRDARDRAPWNLELADGRHRFYVGPDQVPDAGQFVIIDRNGSYPSAMGSVPLAANKLHHTGPRPYGDDAAGLYLINPPVWKDQRIGHPLGRAAEQGRPLWVTAPHMRLLVKLAAQRALDMPPVLDSWTGRATTGLFEPYARWVRDQREQLAAGDPAAYAEFKAATSKAIRLIWPKAAPSPFWRPDWHTAIVAEANVRHWIQAYRCIAAGGVLLAMANTDEAVWWGDEGLSPDWMPPYTPPKGRPLQGLGFGQLKSKQRGDLNDWLAGHGHKR